MPLLARLAPAQLHLGFFALVGVLGVILVLRAWKRDGRLLPSLGPLVFVLTMFYLTSPYAGDRSRIWIALALVVVALAAAWRCRRSVWKPPGIVLALLLGLLVVFLTSSSANLRVFEGFVPKVFAFYFVATLTWLFVRLGLPKVRAAGNHKAGIGMTMILSFFMLVVALVWWLEAVDINVLPKAPVATTGAEIADQFARPWGTRHQGIFVVGKIAPGDASFTAYYSGRSPSGISGNDPASWFPLQFEILLEDGTSVSATGITGVRGTFAWPEGGPHSWQHCLRPGDPVVVWADPGESVGMAGGERRPALTGTRIIAYGSLDDFKANFLAPAVSTARVFGWVGFGALALAGIPLFFALRETI